MTLFRTIPVLLIILICCALPRPSQANETDDTAPWEIWKRDGVHALMRHAVAPGTGDPANFRIGDCSTQRNLDQTGRDQARETGRKISEMGIRIDLVLSSEWCRCVDTATLLDLGQVTKEPSLNSFFRDRSTESVQTSQITDLLSELPPGTKTLLVTHQVNITALTGIYPRSGEIILIRPTENGKIETLARLMP
ncbi:MAG: histidine phosphatase family protein [Pseudomonadota bacterium]|nr:histidine phosphatase family protein [Pseudomonadota bacterium]